MPTKDSEPTTVPEATPAETPENRVVLATAPGYALADENDGNDFPTVSETGTPMTPEQAEKAKAFAAKVGAQLHTKES